MKKILIVLLGSLLILGGCFQMNEKTEEEKEQEGTTPVQDYVGQGFSFVDGDKSAERVKKQEEEIKQEAINYMKTTYKTDVKVNNVVPARNGAVVMVECEEPIQFHTSVIVSLVLNKDDVGSARSDEGEAEKAIVRGLYAKAYEEEFKNLDAFSEEIAKKHELFGMKNEAIDKTSTAGFVKSHYFISLSSLSFPSVYSAFLENQGVSADKLKELFAKDDPKRQYISIPMEFYSKEDKLPKQEVAGKISVELKQKEGLPKGTYGITIYKNPIINRVGLPGGENVDVRDIVK
ncbi:DUF1672 family protein [Listeria seeligeri]|uniref:DUF1672 family protein n=1 Tax=Listeria seeligeri TaxID=1640 RepID=UPI0010EDE07C|nr:DUF1672 family protein [Listeria seeligeri]